MKQRILVTDDVPAVLRIAEYLLENEGYEVSLARDGREALEMLLAAEKKGRAFDLLFTDLDMPRMSGTELMREMRKEGVSVPVVVFTGVGDEKLMDQCMALGCADYLLKPGGIREIPQCVRRVLEGARIKKRKTHSQAVQTWSA